MGFYFDREETEGEIVIRYKKLPFLYICTYGSGLCFLYFFVTGKFPLLIVIFSVGIFAFSFPFWKTNKEIKKAMKGTGVKISGNKYSFRKPLTVIITKHKNDSPQSKRAV